MRYKIDFEKIRNEYLKNSYKNLGFMTGASFRNEGPRSQGEFRIKKIYKNKNHKFIHFNTGKIENTIINIKYYEIINLMKEEDLN